MLNFQNASFKCHFSYIFCVETMNSVVGCSAVIAFDVRGRRSKQQRYQSLIFAVVVRLCYLRGRHIHMHSTVRCIAVTKVSCRTSSYQRIRGQGRNRGYCTNTTRILQYFRTHPSSDTLQGRAEPDASARVERESKSAAMLIDW